MACRGQQPAATALLLLVITAALQGCSRPDAPVDHLDELTWVRTLKTYYPQDYATLRAKVAKAPDFATAAPIVGDTLSAVSLRQRGKADADTARALLQLRLDEGRMLRTVDPAGCVLFMQGAGVPPSLVKVMTPEFAQRDRSIAAQFLEQAATRPASPARPLSAEDADQLWTKAMAGLTRQDRGPAADLFQTGRAPSTPDEARIVCALHLAVADDLLAAPRAEADPLIRSIMAARANVE